MFRPVLVLTKIHGLVCAIETREDKVALSSPGGSEDTFSFDAKTVVLTAPPKGPRQVTDEIRKHGSMRGIGAEGHSDVSPNRILCHDGPRRIQVLPKTLFP